MSHMLKVLDKLDTAPPLQTLLLNALNVLLYDKSLHTINGDPAIEDVVKTQESIGWHQILKGRLALHWKSTQDKYLGSRRTNKANGDSWMKTVIVELLQIFLKLWNLRNEDRHGRDEATQAQAVERQTIREAVQFHAAYAGRVHDDDKWIFTKPIQERLQDAIGNIRIWLNHWKPIIKRGYKTQLETG
jgi:hypothetical protein